MRFAKAASEHPEAVAEQIRALGRKALVVAADVSDQEAVEDRFKRPSANSAAWTCLSATPFTAIVN